jgi:branched-chain amino acid transport system permease protein
MLIFLVTTLTYVGFQGILSLGMSLQWGYTGILNLAYIVSMALGAYTAAVVTLGKDQPPSTYYILGLSLPFYVGIVAAMLAAALFGLVVGGVVLGRKIRSNYLTVATLVIAVVLAQYVSQSTSLFDGSQGLVAVPQPFVNSGLTYNGYQFAYMIATLGLLGIVYVICEILRRSGFGRTLRTIREDEIASQVFGHNVFAMKLKAFVFGSTLSGLAGSLIVFYVGSFNPAGWAVPETIFVLTCLFVGGSGSNIGAVVGTAIVVTFFSQGTQLLPGLQNYPELIPVLRTMLVAALLLIVLRWRPAGLFPERIPRYDRQRRAAGEVPSTAGETAGTGGR